MVSFPTEPGFYSCKVLAIVQSRKDDPNLRPAILEISGSAPYLKAFLFAYHRCEEITPTHKGLLVSIGERITDPSDPR